MKVAVLEADTVSRRRGNRLILDGVSLELFPSEITGLVGANGAGKTTLLMLLSGFLRSHHGTVTKKTEAGKPVPQMLLIDKPSFYPNLRLDETLYWAARVAGFMPSHEQIATTLGRVGLAAFAGSRTSTLSAGMKQRLAWAHAVLLQPAVLLLDEPTSFLDPPGVAELRQTLVTLSSQGSAILFSSHNVHEVHSICDRVLFLEGGHLRELSTGETESPATIEKQFL